MEEKTMLQKIIEQKTEQIRDAIERAIDEGANIKHSKYVSSGYTIDGVHIQISSAGYVYVGLNIESEKIEKACKPSKDELEKMAEQKRAELEEIEKQLKSNEYETDND